MAISSLWTGTGLRSAWRTAAPVVGPSSSAGDLKGRCDSGRRRLVGGPPPLPRETGVSDDSVSMACTITRAVGGVAPRTLGGVDPRTLGGVDPRAFGGVDPRAVGDVDPRNFGGAGQFPFLGGVVPRTLGVKTLAFGGVEPHTFVFDSRCGGASPTLTRILLGDEHNRGR